MQEELNFDGDSGTLEVIEVPVKINGKKYILREASGAAAKAFKNFAMSCVTLSGDGKPTKAVGLAGMQPLLVSMCLFDEDGKNVPQSVIESWPERVQRALYMKVREISTLSFDDDAGDKSKNLQGSTMGGSD